MRTQIQPVGPLVDGFVFNISADQIPASAMSGGQNIFIEDGLVKKKFGYTQLGQTLNGAIMGSDQFSLFDGQSFLLVVTANEIYSWNTGTLQFDRLTPDLPSTAYGENAYGSGVYGGISDQAYGGGFYGEGPYGQGASLQATDADLASFDTFRQLTEDDPWWIVTNGVDEIKKYEGGSSVSDLGGSPPKAKYLIEFKNHLLLLDTTEGGNRNPQRIRWSDTGNAEEWNTGNSSSQDLTGSDFIQGAAKFRGNFLAVLKERSVWLGYATGDSNIFQFDRKTFGMGCAAPHTIDVINDSVIFLGWDDVYTFNGVQLTPISGSIRTALFGSLNPAQLSRAFGVTVEEQKEYWLFLSTTGTYPDTAWVYNYELRRWTQHNYPDNMTNFGFYQVDSTVTFDNLAGTFDARTGRFDDRFFLEAAPTTLLGSNLGEVFEYDASVTEENGTIIDGFFDTKDFNFTSMTQRQRVTRIDVSYVGNGLEVWFSTDKGASWTLATTLSASTDFKRQQVNIRTSEDWIRFRFRDKSIGGQFQFNRAGIHWQTGGRI